MRHEGGAGVGQPNESWKGDYIVNKLHSHAVDIWLGNPLRNDNIAITLPTYKMGAV